MTPTWEWQSRTDTGAVLAVHGDLDVAVGAAFVKAVDEALAAADAPAVVELDLGAVEFIDSSGLRALLEVQQSHGDRVRVGAISPAVHRLLDLTGILDHFGFEGDVADEDDAR
jgi:anti-sigma B factor antagonist